MLWFDQCLSTSFSVKLHDCSESALLPSNLPFAVLSEQDVVQLAVANPNAKFKKFRRAVSSVQEKKITKEKLKPVPRRSTTLFDASRSAKDLEQVCVSVPRSRGCTITVFHFNLVMMQIIRGYVGRGVCYMNMYAI